MKKIEKVNLIILVALLSLGVLLVRPSQVEASGIRISPSPIFEVENFFPGQTVTSTVIIKNEAGKDYEKISLRGERISPTSTYDLAEVIHLTIKKENQIVTTTLAHLFENTLELPDSNLPDGKTTQFEFIAQLDQNAGNEYQGKKVEFYLVFTFEGREVESYAVLGWGGQYSAIGLMIYEETLKVTTSTETSFTITWMTNFPATSYVIYAKEGEPHNLDLTDNTGTPPKYGYARTTLEYDIIPKVIYHSVTITGLEPGTTYYFRAVSRGSLAISQEYSFTTLGKKVEIGLLKEKKGVTPKREVLGEETTSPTEEIVPPPSEILPPEEQIIPPPLEKQAPFTYPGFASLLLASLVEIGRTPWKLILVIFCLITLIILALIKRKKKEKPT